VKTARGKTINMANLAARNETARAVSNMPINARGDIIDNRGKVRVSRELVQQELNKNTIVGVTEEVSVKEDNVTVPVVVEEINNEPTEISRELRERKDGSLYYEVEYSDGSMEEIEAED
jgi:hypothetical protein